MEPMKAKEPSGMLCGFGSRMKRALASALLVVLSSCASEPPPPPKPEPELTTTRLPWARMVCCWPTNYPEYTLQATRRLRSRQPEKEKWATVTNEAVVGESSVCVTNRIARWGRHYRLVKE